MADIDKEDASVDGDQLGDVLNSKVLMHGLETNKQSLLLNDIREIGKSLSLSDSDIQNNLKKVPLRYQHESLLGFAAASIEVKFVSPSQLTAIIRYVNRDLFTSQGEFDRWTRIEEFVHYTQAALNPEIARKMGREAEYYQSEGLRRRGVNDAAMLMRSDLRGMSERAFDSFATGIGVAAVRAPRSEKEIKLAIRTVLGFPDEASKKTEDWNERYFTFGQAEKLYEQLLEPEFTSLLESYNSSHSYHSFTEKDLKRYRWDYKHYSKFLDSVTNDDNDNSQGKYYRREKDSVKRSLTYSIQSFFEWVMEEGKLTPSQLVSLFEKANISLDSLRYRQVAMQTALSDQSISQLRQGVITRLQNKDISSEELFSLAQIAADGSSYVVRVHQERESESEKRTVQSTVQRELVIHLDKLGSFDETIAFLDSDDLSAKDVIGIADLHGIFLNEVYELRRVKSGATADMITTAKSAIKEYVEEQGPQKFNLKVKNGLVSVLTQSCRYEQQGAVAKAMISADLLLFVDDLPSDPAMRNKLVSNPEWMRLQQEALNDPNLGPLNVIGIDPVTFVEKQNKAFDASKLALSKLYTGAIEGELSSFVAEERSKIAFQMSLGMSRQPADVELDYEIHREKVAGQFSEGQSPEQIDGVVLDESMDFIRDENRRRFHDNELSLLIEPIAKVIAFDVLGKPVEEIPFQSAFTDYGAFLNASEVKVWVKDLQSFIHKATPDEKKTFMRQSTFVGQQEIVKKVLRRRGEKSIL